MDLNFTLAQLLTIIFGSGGIGVVITAWSNRKKPKAEAAQLLTDAFEDRLKNLGAYISTLQCRVEALENQISGLKTVLSDREVTIVNLQQENLDLQKQVDSLRSQVSQRDKRIRELEKQVAQLQDQFKAMQSNTDMRFDNLGSTDNI